MRKNLLEFLFGPSVIREDVTDQALGEQVVQMFEDADELEKADMAVNKKPLETALKSIGVSGQIEALPQWAEVHFADSTAYHEACNAVFTPDALHKLAELGWIPAKCGDQAMSNEPASFKLGFFEIDVAGEEASDKEKAPALKTVMKDGREADTDELERADDELNPVETDDKTSDDNQKGVGDAKNGTDPKGSPKGSKKNESLAGMKLRWKTGTGRGDPEHDAPSSERLGTPYSPDQTAGFKSSVHSAQCQCWPCRKKRDQAYHASVRFEPPLEEGAHKAGCQCGFCKNMGSFGKKKKDAEGKKGKEGKETDNDEPKVESLTAHEIAEKLLETTMCSAIPPLEMGTPGQGLETKGRDGKKLGRKFKMPGAEPLPGMTKKKNAKR